MIRDRVHRETERSARYGREFSILAVRQTSQHRRRVASHIRDVDEIIHCWRGVTLILLPETSREGAVSAHERVRSHFPETASAAIVTCPDDGATGDEMMTRLLTLMRADARPGQVITLDPEREQVAAVGA